MFINISTDDFVIAQDDSGWSSLDLDYFNKHPDKLRKVDERFSISKTALRTLSNRYRRINEKGRSIGQTPKRGVAVTRGETNFLFNWMDYLTTTFEEHYGDLFGQKSFEGSTAQELNRYVTFRHEEFQFGKMGIFAPFKRNALVDAIQEYIDESREENAEHIPLAETEVIVNAFRKMREVDLGNIEDGSLSLVDAHDAVYESNVQGLATGYIQLTRDDTLNLQRAVELTKLYGFRFSKDSVLADELVKCYNEVDIDFDIAWNVVTNLRRVQVGGIQVSLEEALNRGISKDDIKKAKYRVINTNDPLVQIAEASASIPFREAIKTKCPGNFYNTLYDPDERWARLNENLDHCAKIGVTQFPFDFEHHDARLHAEWMFNLMQLVVKPLFREEDQPVIDLVSLCLVYKLILAPTTRRRNWTTIGLIGSLGSGDPWTNIIGTLGTRAVSYVLAESRPDIFYVDSKVGMNNGDDTGVGIYRSAIEQYGINNIIAIANDIVNALHYYFNDAKLIIIPLPNGDYVMHWEQFCLWKNPISDDNLKHGSSLRYFGKVYTCEDIGRANAREGLIDQLSTLNNTVAYIGDGWFTTTTFNLEILAQFIKNDNLLHDYVNKHGNHFLKELVRDEVKDKVQKRSQLPEDKGKKREDLEMKIRNDLLHRLHVSGFDKDRLSRVVLDEDFTFFGVSRLIALGPAELLRIAGAGKGLLIKFRYGNLDGPVSDWIDWKVA